MADERPYFYLAERAANTANSLIPGAHIDPEWIYAQWRHESTDFTSLLARSNFNFSGLTQTEPNGEENKQPDGPNYYKWFPTPEAFADYFGRYISLYASDGVGSAQTMEEYAAALKHGGYFTDSLSNYINGMRGKVGSVLYADPFTDLGAYSVDSFYYPRTPDFYVGRNEPLEPERSAWDRFTDSFWLGNHDSGDVAAVRYMWAGAAAGMDTLIQTGQFVLPGFDAPYTPSEEEKTYVSDLLKDDEIAQDFVLQNARNSQHLYRLAAMKKEDYDLQQRVIKDGMHEGWNIAGGIGGLAGGALTPANLVLLAATVGGGAGAIAGKVAGATIERLALTQAVARMGTAAMKLSPLAQIKAVRIAKNAIAGAGYMGVDRYLASNFGGFTPDYGLNMAIGATLASAFGALKGTKAKNKALDNMAQTLDRIETDTLHLTYDTLPSSHLKPRITADLKRVHLKDTLETVVPKTYRQTFAKLDNMFMVNESDMKTIADKYNLKIDTKKPYIVIPGTNIRVFNASKIRSSLAMGVLLKQDKMFFSLEERADKILNNGWQKAAKNDSDTLIDYLVTISDPKDKMAVRLIQGLKKQWQKEGIKFGRMSDKKVLSLIRERAEDIRQSRQSIHAMKDGTVFVDGVPYGKDNPLNVKTELEWLADATEVESYMQGELPDWIRKGNIAQALENGKAFRTTYGVLSNSRVKRASTLAHLLFHDDRMRGKLHDTGYTNNMAAENIKQDLAYPFFGMLDNYLDIRNEWIKQQPGLFKVYGTGRKLFDKQVMDYYNWEYAGNKAGHAAKVKPEDWDPLVKKAGDVMHAIRDGIITKAREDARFHGGRLGENTSFLSKDWVPPLHNEMIRHTDEDALAHWLSERFGNNRKAAVDYLDKYAHAAGRIEEVGERLQADNPEAHISVEQIQKQYDKECREWAENIIDKGQSQITFAEQGRAYGNDPITYMRHRFPMDTSTKLSDGFSFDDVLRDNDIETLMKSYINRMTGEIAVSDVLGNWRSNGVLDKVMQDWEKAKGQVGGLSPGTVDTERRALEDGLSQILGIRSKDNPPTTFSAISQMLRNKTYADVGGQMTMAQMGEYGGAMGYAGTRVLLRSIPLIRDLRNSIISQDTKKLESLGKEVTDFLYGKDLHRRIWDSNSSYTSHVFRDVMARGSKVAAGLDRANEAIKITANITSSINQLPRLTNEMITQGRIAGIVDSMKWGLGDDFAKDIRQPFSPYYLKAVGVKTEDQAMLLRNAIKKYLGKKPTGAELTKALEDWRMKDSETFFQWRNWVDNYSRKVIQQMSVGGTPITKEQNGFTQLVFQFKDYVMRAVNSQMMRALTSRQADDALAAVYSMGTNMVSYMGLVYLRAFAYYPTNYEERQAYIERNLSMGRLAWAAVSRGAITGSLPSFASDFYEMTTGTPMMRTTVNNSYNPRSGIFNSKGSVGDIAGSVVGQMPAVRTVIDPFFYLGRVGGRIYDGKPFTSEDLRDAMRLVPLNGWWGMTALASTLSEVLDLPSRKKKREPQAAAQKKAAETLKPTPQSKPTALNKTLTPMSGSTKNKKNKSDGMSLIMKEK